MLSHLNSNSNLVMMMLHFYKDHYIIAGVLSMATYWTLKCLRRPKNLPPGPISIPFFGGAWALTGDSYKDFENLWKYYGNIVSIYIGNR